MNMCPECKIEDIKLYVAGLCPACAGKYITAQAQQIKELESELEGKSDAFDEVFFQLDAKVEKLTAIIAEHEKAVGETKEQRLEGLHIKIVQLGGPDYFWVLMRNKEVLALSAKIRLKAIIETEADELAAQLDLPIIVIERS